MIIQPGLRRSLGGGLAAALAYAGFILPLKSSLILARGSGSSTFTRADSANYVATVIDFEGRNAAVESGESRFTGARRVENLIDGSSEDNTNHPAGVTTANVTETATTLTFTATNASYWYKKTEGGMVFPLNSIITVRCKIASTVARTVLIRLTNTASAVDTVIVNVPVTSVPKEISLNVTFATIAGGVLFGIDNRGVAGATDTSTSGIITFTDLQIENVTGQTNQNPSELVSAGILSAPYHGANVDRVQYFEYQNGNTVDPVTRVVTEARGTDISSAVLKEILTELAATNYFLNSTVPATQSISLGLGTYTCWLTGTGNITVSAGTATITGAGVATSATPVTFVVTVAGTVSFTVAGTVSTAQVEGGSLPTSLIITGAASASRGVDVESVPTSGNIIAAQGSIYLEYTPLHSPSGTVFLWGTYVDASNYTAILHDGTNLIFRKRIAATNYDATIANAFVAGTTYKMAASWGSAGTSIALNGTLGTPNANTTAAQIGAAMQIGADGNGANQSAMNQGLAKIWQAQLNDVVLTGLTA